MCISSAQRQTERHAWLHLPTYVNKASLCLPLSPFFISLIGNLSTLCEIKAENQCLVSNNFQTNLFHLFFPFSPPLLVLSGFFFSLPPLPPPNANRGSRVMTSLSLLSCSNNALKIERKKEECDRERRGDAGEKKKESKKWVD